MPSRVSAESNPPLEMPVDNPPMSYAEHMANMQRIRDAATLREITSNVAGITNVPELPGMPEEAAQPESAAPPAIDLNVRYNRRFVQLPDNADDIAQEHLQRAFEIARRRGNFTTAFTSFTEKQWSLGNLPGENRLVTRGSRDNDVRVWKERASAYERQVAQLREQVGEGYSTVKRNALRAAARLIGNLVSAHRRGNADEIKLLLDEISGGTVEHNIVTAHAD